MSMRSLSVSMSLLLGLGFACDNTEVVARRMPRASGGASGNGSAGGGTGAASGMAGTSGKAGAGSAGVPAGGGSGEGGDVSGAGNDFGGAGHDSGGAGEGGAGTGAAGGASGAGSGGMAGSSGKGGNGGTGGVIEPTPECDDGNPCTTDAFRDGACQHDTAQDGTPCDDGDLCTLGDRCVARECVTGERRSGAADVLGRVRSYGTLTNSVVVSPGDRRYFFIDRPAQQTRITSTHIVDGSLMTDASTGLSGSFVPPVATAFGDLVAVADGNSSFSIGGPARVIELVSVAGDGSLSPRGTVSIGSGGTVPAITSLTGSGTRLFVCTNFALFSPPVLGTLHWIDVSNPDAPVTVATGAVGAACGSIATSADATRVYVNSASGVRIADLSKYDDSGSITFEEAKLVPGDSGLHARADRLLARTGTELRVFDEPSRNQLASFSVAGAHAAALTAAGIFVQGDRSVQGGTEFFAALYDQTGTLLTEQSILNVAYPIDIVSQKPVVGADSALFSLNNQLLSLVDATISTISTPRVGTFNQLFLGLDERVHSRSRYFAHRIDVSDPLNPSIVAGGPHRNPWLGIKLDRSLVPAALLSEVDREASDTRGNLIDVRTSLGHASSTRVEPIVVAGDERHLPSQTSFEIGAGPAVVLSAGDFIYRAEIRANGKVRFRRFSKGAMFQRVEDGGPLVGIEAASMDLELTAPDSASLLRFDVDPVARRAVVGVARNSVDPMSVLHSIDLASDPPVVEHSSLLTYLPGVIRVHGEWVAYSEGSNLAFRRIGEDADASSVPGVEVQAILAFDGKLAYVGSTGALRVFERGVNGESALLAQLSVEGTPTALVSTPNALVAVSSGEVLTLSPECR